MATKPTAEERHETPRRELPKRITRFEAPKEISPHWNLDSDAEDHLTGLVTTDRVRELLDAFGLAERKDVVFPFQHIARSKGEIWSMRVEPLTAHTLDGKPVMAHAWTYSRQYPESNSAPA